MHKLYIGTECHIDDNFCEVRHTAIPLRRHNRGGANSLSRNCEGRDPDNQTSSARCRRWL